MTDISDRATERETELNGDALAEHYRHDPTHGKTVEDSARACVGCGATIPEERREAVPGVTLCKDCQDDADFLAEAARRNGRPV